jgi:hypothetical protein
MKKILVSVLLLCVALQLPADSGQTETFVFDGSQSTKQLTLRGEKTHVEYETTTSASTCYRSVIAGYRTECRQIAETICPNHYYYDDSELSNEWQRPPPPGGPRPPSGNPPSRPPSRPEPRPQPPSRPNPPPSRPNPPTRPLPPSRPNPPTRPLPPGRPNPPSYPPTRPYPPSYPRPQCYTQYRNVCSEVPYYVSEAYTCYQTHQTAKTVKDYDVIANVIFNFGPVPAGVQAREQFNVTLNGENLWTPVKDSGQLVIFSERKNQASQNGGLLNLAVTYDIDFASKNEILAPFAMDPAGFAIKSDVLTFDVGHVVHPDTFLPELKIKQDGDTLIERALMQSEYQLVNQNGRTSVVVNLLGLGLKLDRAEKAEVKVTTKLIIAGNVVNPGALPSKLEKSGKAKIKVE